MKIQPYVSKLEKSREYKEFIGQYPDSFLVAGFFVLDLEEGKNVHQVDFYVPSQKKIAAFALDGEVSVKLLEMMNSKKKPEKLNLKTKIDLEALPGILMDEMRNRGMSEEIKKVIAVIQNIDGKKIWNLNCVLSGMEILKSHIEDDSKTVLKIEKTSILDIMKKLPAANAANIMKAPETKEDVEEEIKKLDKVAQEIEKAKEKLKLESKKGNAVKKSSKVGK